MTRRLKRPYRNILKTAAAIALIVILKWLWVTISTMGHGTFEGEKTEILRRRNYLANKLLVSPEEVINEMPEAIGPQFQGEWAMYSCSMMSAALANISMLYPNEKEKSVGQIDSLIKIVMSPELRQFDAARWNEDPLESLDSDQSHMSYLSILAWMISSYKTAGGNDKYDELYHQLCATLHRRMKESPALNLPTYPGEPIYVPDMLVTLVALSNFTWQCDDRYQSTINEWLKKAKTEWTDKKTGILKSFLNDDGTPPDFVNASPTRNRPVHKPQRECNISTTSRIGYGGAILFISHRVTRIKIITADYQVVTSAS